MKYIENFPYVDTTIKGDDNKRKYPATLDSSDIDTINWYLKHGHEFVFIEDKMSGKRFNVDLVTLSKPDGTTYKNTRTLSKPVAEGLCLRKHNGKIQLCVLTQSRSPYVVEVNGKQYARFFQEMVGGLAEDGESLEEAAIREIKEEIGYEVDYVKPLINGLVPKHVSYTDETSLIFYAMCKNYVGQHLDDEEDISTAWYDLDKVEKEFDEYHYGDGSKQDFFGFDMSEMFRLALATFFEKLHRGIIKL